MIDLARVRHAVRSVAQENAEDLFFGQVVTIWARWFVILAGALLTLWSAPSVTLLAAEILVVVAMMATNFLFHARYLMEKPANRQVLIGGSLLDLCCITLVVSSWGPSFGLASPFFVFYYPVVLAFAFVFPPRLGGAFTVCAVALYCLTCIAVDPTVALHMGTLKLLADRVITVASVGALGGYYWRVQRAHRRRLAQSPPGEPPIPHFDVSAATSVVA